MVYDTPKYCGSAGGAYIRSKEDIPCYSIPASNKRQVMQL